MTKENTGNHTEIETTQVYLEEAKQPTGHKTIETTQLYFEESNKKENGENNMTKESSVMTKGVVLSFISEAGNEINFPKEKQKLIELAVDTGLRLKELLDLEWNQFGWNEEFIKLTGAGVKNREYVEVISHDLYNDIVELKNGEGYEKVFHNLNEKIVSDMMSRISRKLGYDDRQYSFHSFKKFAVAFAVEMAGGIPDDYINK